MTVLLTFACLAATSALAMPSYNDVLLVVNAQSPESQHIGAYFKAARNIPDANVCTISVSAALGTGGRMGNAEKWAALSTIKNHLTKNGLTDKINYIVLTHGIPKYAYTGKKGPNYNGDPIDLYHLFDVFLMYQLSESAADSKFPNIFTDNKYYYYNNVPAMQLCADAPGGQDYVDLKNAESVGIGDTLSFFIKDNPNINQGQVVSVEPMSSYYHVKFLPPLWKDFTAADSYVKSSSGTGKKFSKTKFGYYVVGRLDGLGTATIKSMIDNTGFPACESYKKQANGKIKLLTFKPAYNNIVISEIKKRGNIEVTSPVAIPPDVWNPVTRTITLVDVTGDNKVTIDTTFDKVGKDAMFCYLDDVSGGTGGFVGWPTENDYYADGDFVQDYPFIYRGATFLPGSIMMIYRSNPAAYDSHGGTGGVYKMNVSTKAKTSYVKIDASDMKFRHTTCVEYDPVNNQLWVGTGKNQLDVAMNFDQRCTDDAHRETMRNDGGGIVIYDTAGNILKWINANDLGSPLKNNRVTKLVYDNRDSNAPCMWVVHDKGIQYYDCKSKTWYDIPELQNDYAAASGLYLDQFGSDKVYFAFYYNGASANTKKVSSQITGADTSIFEYSKSAKKVTSYVIDSVNNKGLAPRMGKTSVDTIWVSKGNVLYRYDLNGKTVVEMIDMNNVIPEKATPPANLNAPVTIDAIRNVIAIPAAKTVIATVGCNIVYKTDLIPGTPSACQKKNYIVRITENILSTVEVINISEMNSVDGKKVPDFKVMDVVADPATSGKTVYMALSNPGTVIRSTDGSGKSWSIFSSDYTAFNYVNGISLDGKGNIYSARGYFVGQNIAADFQAFGLCAHGGGMVHDGMDYATTGSDATYLGAYTANTDSWNVRSGNGRGVSQVEPMMFMLLDGFYTGEARLGVHKCYPTTGGGGHVGHMTVFEPKCAPFAPRVNEPLIPANPQVKDKQIIEIPIISPGLPWHMNDWIMSTFNKDTVQITDETGTVFTPAKYEFIKPSGPDPDDKDTGKKYITGTGKLVITGNYTGVLYKVKLICGINGLKNIKGASLTNTRPNEFKDEITLNFGNGMDISKGVYISPDEISGPVKMPQNNSKVDLVVSSIALSPAPPVAGKPLTVKFQIKNIGTVKTSTGTITAGVYWNNILIGSVTHGDLAAGASTAVLSVTLNAQYVTAGNKNTVMAVADSTNIVIEMRETNNTNSATFLIDNRPDLKVTAITLSSTKPGKTTVNFKIANTGFGPTAAGTGTQTASVYVNNNLAGTVNYNDLAKGAVVSLQLANVTVTAGTCKVKVVADSAGIVPEVSKTNNSLEKPFSIK